MLSDTSLDIFDELFFDQKLDREGSSVSCATSTDDVSSDSGHGSPAGSCSFLNSPAESCPWGKNIDNTFWGSILDDLPDEFSDNELADLQSDVFPTVHADCADHFTYSPLFATAHINEDVNEYDIQAVPFNLIANQMPSEDIAASAPITSTSTAVVSTDLQSKPFQFQGLPLILKKINDAENVKSHIKIGKNMFAIVQSTNSQCVNMPVTASVNINSTQATTDEKLMNKHNEIAQQIKVDDHDYYCSKRNVMESTGGVSQGIGPGLVLTNEEKRLLEMENMVIPENCGLTKDEETVLRKVRRKIKNKQSAMESRQRRKEYISNLEKRVKLCTEQNQSLKTKVDSLSDENKSLLTQLKQLQSIVSASVQQRRNTQKGTCLAVLVLSFAFFFLPFNPMINNVNVKTTDSPLSTEMWRSRTLLNIDEAHDHDEYHNDNLSSGNDDDGHYNDNLLPGNGAVNTVNESKLFSDEMRAQIEALLVSSEDGSLIKAKLATYMENAGNVLPPSLACNMKKCRIVELDENDTKWNRKPFSTEM